MIYSAGVWYESGLVHGWIARNGKSSGVAK